MEKESPWEIPRQRRRAPTKEVISSFFVSNVPEGWVNAHLWRTYQHLRKMRDAFIPYKKGRLGETFAFVRFANVEDMEGFLETLKVVELNNRRVEVSVAKHCRNFTVRKGRILDLRQPKGAQTSPSTARVSVAMPEGSLSSTGVVPGISFKQMVTQNEVDQVRSVIVDPLNLSTKVTWRLDSLWGEAKNLGVLENMRNFFEAIGLQEVDLKYLGGLSVIMVFQSEDSASQFLDHGVASWQMWFSSLKRWDGFERPFHRLAWLSVRGIPPCLWDASVVDHIGELYCRVILNSEVTRSNHNMAVAKCCVLILDGWSIKENYCLLHMIRSFQSGWRRSTMIGAQILRLLCVETIDEYDGEESEDFIESDSDLIDFNCVRSDEEDELD